MENRKLSKREIILTILRNPEDYSLKHTVGEKGSCKNAVEFIQEPYERELETVVNEKGLIIRGHFRLCLEEPGLANIDLETIDIENISQGGLIYFDVTSFKNDKQN